MKALKKMINVALPKGRLGEKAYAMFEAAGYECPSIREESRKLIFENPEKGVRYFWVKPSDVVIYVERGAADIGIAGKDIILNIPPISTSFWIWEWVNAEWRLRVRRILLTAVTELCVLQPNSRI